MNEQQSLPTEPYPFATVLQIKPGSRHELLTAVVYQSDPPKCGSGYRYQCLFPREDAPFQVAKVYSDEIEDVTGTDTNGDLLCKNCPADTRNYCFSAGITPATCC